MSCDRTDWIDISVPLVTGMVHWPDNPPVRIERTLDLRRGDAANVSELSMGMHTGTHVDAPSHFFEGAVSIDQMPIDALMGRALVIEIVNPRAVFIDELKTHPIGVGDRVLLKTRNSPHAWNAARFVEDFVYLSTEAAEWLVDRGVRVIGIDYLSVGGYAAQNGAAVHQTLLGSGVWVIEGLDLTQAPPGECELVCLPLKVLGGDGAPARAVLRPVREKEHDNGQCEA